MNTQRPLELRTILLGLGVVLAFLAYWGGLSELVTRWHKQEEYGHGFFIPLIVGWLLWHRRDALRQSIGAPCWLAVPLLLLSAGMLVVGELTALFLLIQLGFLLALVGLVLAFGGVSLLRLTILPIALLLFCIPLPYFVDAQLSWRLQLLSSWLGVELLRVLGYSVFLEGNVIDLGVFRLQVVEACSGLRYLYPLLSIGFLMAYMYKATFWRRAIVFVSTVPVTVLMNSARITVVGILVERWGGGMADGFLHYFEGWVIFLVCLLCLVGEVWLFERFGARRPVLDAVDVPVLAPVAPSGPAGQRSPLVLGLLLAILIGGFALAQVVGGRDEDKPARSPLILFPSALGDWQGKLDTLPADIERGLGFDDYYLADFVGPEAKPVNFYVAYYASQRKGVSPHSPQVCIPGGGWVISSLSRVPVSLVDGGEVEVVRVVIDKENQRQVVYYWFEQRGRHIANEYLMKWYLLKDALLRNRTDGALVRVTTVVVPGEADDAPDQRLAAFIRLAMPHVGKFVPQ